VWSWGGTCGSRGGGGEYSEIVSTQFLLAIVDDDACVFLLLLYKVHTFAAALTLLIGLSNLLLLPVN